MPDTKRDKAALVALFPDNTTGLISPQDLRDFLESLDLTRGAYYVSTTAATTITSASSGGLLGNNYVKIAGTTTSKTVNRFTHADNKLTYASGLPSIRADLVAHVSFNHASGSPVDVGVKWALNGIPIDESYNIQTVPASSKVVIPCVGETTLGATDYVELFVANETDTTNLTAQALFAHVAERPLA